MVSILDPSSKTFVQLRQLVARKQKKVSDVTKERNRALRELRLACIHLELAECPNREALRPQRLCLACGAQEEGWGSGYQVLSDMIIQHKDNPALPKERKIVKKCASHFDLFDLRPDGPIYKVGQSHKNNEGRGRRTYTMLTEIPEE
jgi:hypothetical protein